MNRRPHNKNFIFIPLFAIAAFILLYIAAALLYPGGCDGDHAQAGFSLTQNYWCDLLKEYAINKEPNISRPFAISAMVILFSGLAVFWYFVPFLFDGNKRTNYTIRICGISSMVVAAFLFTPFHDLVINVAGITGVIAFVAAFIALLRSGRKRLFYMGVFSLSLCFVNYIIYYTGQLIIVLPLLQKITFLFCLSWIVSINIIIYRTLNGHEREVQNKNSEL